MTKPKPPFRADHVGSLMRPKSVLEERSDAAAKKNQVADLGAIQDAKIIVSPRTRKRWPVWDTDGEIGAILPFELLKG